MVSTERASIACNRADLADAALRAADVLVFDAVSLRRPLPTSLENALDMHINANGRLFAGRPL
jgi:hypothetical protein